MMDFANENKTLVCGLAAAEAARPASIVGSIFNVAEFSSFAPTSDLSNKRTYPYFSRISLSMPDHVNTLYDALDYYEKNGGYGWKNVAIASDINIFNINFAEVFISSAGERDITILAYRTFLQEEKEFETDLTEIKNSGARFIICLVITGYPEFIDQANEFELIGENYAWFVPAPTVSFSFYEPRPLAKGTLSSFNYFGNEGIYFECFTKAWRNADPTYYPYAGNGNPPITAYLPFDMVILVAEIIGQLDDEQLLNDRISAEIWSDKIRNITYTGLIGSVSFNSDGDRVNAETSLLYYDEIQNKFLLSGIRSDQSAGLQFINDVVWYSNTTDIPDLDIRPPFNYWSCHDKKEKTDPTGKTVELFTPDGSDIDDIDSAYHCDQFIDCKNLSDESIDCNKNYTILFIIFGIIGGILILFSLLLIGFVILFGMILNYQRIRVASPVFLIILLITIIIGISSIFTTFGKPHPVSCAFQPWLLGLPAVSMISCLSVKNFRIWRIFRYPLKRTKVTDFELFILWSITMIPAIIIIVLWMIISTPTAQLEERDDKDHFICTTGGFTGTPGGLIFFIILLCYCIFVLFIGALISILVRKAPSLYNESRILTISIYNLCFLAVIIIPLYLTLSNYEPFIAWILRTCAVLYAFSATLFLQFIPRVFGILIIDKGKNVTRMGVIASSTNSTVSTSMN